MAASGVAIYRRPRQSVHAEPECATTSLLAVWEIGDRCEVARRHVAGFSLARRCLRRRVSARQMNAVVR
jgi:hypothetical protein